MSGLLHSYPAAYNYVLGIEDARWLYQIMIKMVHIHSISNLLNYELRAPGTAIMSTIPNGGYATLTGTSMATPLVAGGLAFYNQKNLKIVKN